MEIEKNPKNDEKKKIEESDKEEDDCFEEFLFNDKTKEEVEIPSNDNQLKYWEEQWSDDEKSDLLLDLKREIGKTKA